MVNEAETVCTEFRGLAWKITNLSGYIYVSIIIKSAMTTQDSNDLTRHIKLADIQLAFNYLTHHKMNMRVGNLDSPMMIVRVVCVDDSAPASDNRDWTTLYSAINGLEKLVIYTIL